MTTTLITGANKGLGYETARRLIAQGHTVYAGARDAGRGQAAAAELGAQFVQLDVTDDASVESALKQIGEREGKLDVLINNAGIWDGTVGIDGLTGAAALAEFDTNAVGVIRVTQAAVPLLRKSDNPVIVNVTSSLGSFWAVTNPDRHESQAAFVVYGATKAAVSMLTVQYAKALPGIKVNAVEPGYTATDLTRNGGGQQPSDGAEVIAAAATIDKDGPTGTLRERGGVLAW
jgi:NAD(P)-dependent dehydrogenase (short-subunit alcohol dehydrogenase family)